MIKRIDPARVVIALGSNLGDRRALLDGAITALDATPGIRVEVVSRYHESVAITLRGRDEEAPSYLNAVAIIYTVLSPEALLEECHRIENESGRVRAERWGSRTLDLDIIDYAGIRLETPELTLPHPRAAEREFVLAPWVEIERRGILPGVGRISAALAALRLASEIR